jgi:plasmid maintenance system antidote protein VapI
MEDKISNEAPSAIDRAIRMRYGAEHGAIADMAREMGVPYRRAYQWVRRKKIPGKYAMRLSEMTGVSLRKLLAGE